jgi:hypothetical protein
MTPAVPPSPLALGLLHLLKHLRPFEARACLREASSALDAAELSLLRRQLPPRTTTPEAPAASSTGEILARALPRRRWGVPAAIGAAVALCGAGAALLVERSSTVCPEVIAALPCPGPAPVAPEVEPAPLAPPSAQVRRQAGGPKRQRPAARTVDPFDSRF